MRELCYDYDSIIYACGFVNETRYINVKNKITGKKSKYKNRTEFWGNKRKVIEGELAIINDKRIANGETPYTKDDFELEDVQEAGDPANTFHTLKCMINGINRDLQADSYVGFIGKGDCFRLDRSTIFKYKGNRENALRPILKDEMVDYLVKHHKAKVVTGLEADDWVNIHCYQKKSIAVTTDKDALGCPILIYNHDYPDLGIQDGNCFGELFQTFKEDKKGVLKPVDVKGLGRKFFYYQLAYGDDIDNYRANCASEKDWGKVSAFNSMVGARNDLEALEAVRDVYKYLYPNETEIIGWRGDKLVVDWLYVFNEVWDLARMRRAPNDIVTGEEVLRKFKLI